MTALTCRKICQFFRWSREQKTGTFCKLLTCNYHVLLLGNLKSRIRIKNSLNVCFFVGSPLLLSSWFQIASEWLIFESSTCTSSNREKLSLFEIIRSFWMNDPMHKHAFGKYMVSYFSQGSLYKWTERLVYFLLNYTEKMPFALPQVKTQR